jgi:hypothetical protein
MDHAWQRTLVAFRQKATLAAAQSAVDSLPSGGHSSTLKMESETVITIHHPRLAAAPGALRLAAQLDQGRKTGNQAWCVAFCMVYSTVMTRYISCAAANKKPRCLNGQGLERY